VHAKNVYGRETYYPACDTAKLLAQLTGHKTFTDADIRTIRQLGYTIQIEQVAARFSYA
jgi:hypothetical protein